jgi:hypothetical protein
MISSLLSRVFLLVFSVQWPWSSSTSLPLSLPDRSNRETAHVHGDTLPADFQTNGGTCRLRQRLLRLLKLLAKA